MSGPILVFVELGTGDAAGEADRLSLEALALRPVGSPRRSAGRPSRRC